MINCVNIIIVRTLALWDESVLVVYSWHALILSQQDTSSERMLSDAPLPLLSDAPLPLLAQSSINNGHVSLSLSKSLGEIPRRISLTGMSRPVTLEFRSWSTHTLHSLESSSSYITLEMGKYKLFALVHGFDVCYSLCMRLGLS